ncbi:hypothetical protein ACFL0W_02460 [Nanoarchaeota archaeon]
MPAQPTQTKAPGFNIDFKKIMKQIQDFINNLPVIFGNLVEAYQNFFKDVPRISRNIGPILQAFPDMLKKAPRNLQIGWGVLFSSMLLFIISIVLIIIF